MENEVMYIKLDDIIPNRFQPREYFDEESLEKLADSIRQHGVIEPILVRPVSNKFEIIAGERRYKASVLAGLTKIPALVKQMDDKESSIVAYIENEHRSDVSAIEEARTIDRILKSNNMTQEQLAKEIGINQSTLANKLRLLSLPLEIQEALMHNEISERHARSLLSIKDAAKQIEMLKKIKEKRMTVRELDGEIKSMNDFNYGNMQDNIYSNYNNDVISSSTPNQEDPDFMNYLNNYDNNNTVNNQTPTLNQEQEDLDFMNYLNNYDNSNTVNNETPTLNQEQEDPKFMNYLNNYDNNMFNEPNQNTDEIINTTSNYNDYLNNYGETKDNNVMINNVTPPITSDFNPNTYVENNPNFVDVSKSVMINNVDEIIDKLKVVVDNIKNNSKFKVDTDEINYDDFYQITIKIDKRDF